MNSTLGFVVLLAMFMPYNREMVLMELYVTARVWSWISYSLTYKYIVDSITIHFPFTLLSDVMIILVWLFHLERPLSLPRPFYPTPASVASSGLCFVRADCFALISSCGWVGALQDLTSGHGGILHNPQFIQHLIAEKWNSTNMMHTHMHLNNF